ncbi:MAG: hypothetical protein ABS46_00515 [Cytophagaceae bacterium SCN 52-12]|nr:MAG: hypothetical protein ABS46_00515 [Cytophagaceae bacterium SCN 52-12]
MMQSDLLKVKVIAMALMIVLLLSGIARAESSVQSSRSAHFPVSPENTRELAEVLNELKGRYKVHILYNDQQVEGIGVRVDRLDYSAGIEQNLRAILSDTGLKYRKAKGNSYLITGKRIEQKVAVLTEQEAGDARPEESPQIVHPEIVRQDVKGVVRDEKGELLPGVSILVKGSQAGTITDGEGRFSLSVADGNTVLVFSFVGYISQEVTVGSRTNLEISLEVDEKALEEVIVVGYGEQKKVNLTGSVSTISADELVKRPAPNAQNLLQGKVPGLQVVQNSGQPGDDGAVMTIRGMGTFSAVGNAPLVLIDGIVGDMTNLNADNIESVSVLKDAASSSIYGARAANGVILITTKKGAAGSFNLDYRADFQLHQPTALPELVTNSADYMEYWNTARTRASQAALFTQQEIDAYRTATDRVRYPNFDWVKYMVGNAASQNHYLSANGGGDKTTYNLALGYLDQDGIVTGHDFKRYNFNLNLDSKVNNIVSIGGRIAWTRKIVDEPTYTDDNYMLTIYSRNPTTSVYLPDGSGRFAGNYRQGIPSNRNPVSILASGGTTFEKNNLAAQTYLDVNILKNLKWSVKGAVNFVSDFSKLVDHPVDVYFFSDGQYQNNGVSTTLGVRDNFNTSLLTTVYSTLHYSRDFAGGHSLEALAGYNQESFVNRFLQGSRVSYPSSGLTEIDGGSVNGQATTGTSYEWAIQSFFGRLGYNFKEKYLLEANFRYDGTSRLHSSSRWGGFPSISAGWRVSNEEFLKGNSWLHNLKIRASWGKLGNQNIDYYPYQDILSVSTYPFATLEQGVVQTRLTDKNLRWETTTLTDLGLDFSLFNGKLSGTLDLYRKITDDILYNIEIPMSIGLDAPTVNFAKMENKGFELELSHTNRLGGLKYTVHGNFSTNRNKVLKVRAPFYDTNNTIQEGLPWMSNYMVEWIGIFQSQEDIDNSPTHPFNPKPGDLKFKDQNNDGVINADDRVVVDGAYPDFYYGGGLNLSWKQFDLSAFFQGLEGMKFFVDRWGTVPFTQGSAPTLEFAENAWTEENKTNQYPAMYQDGYGPVTGTRSTFFLQDASYLRLKNLVVGYTLPAALARKAKMKNLRIYVSGDNLLTFTKYPGADPERLGVGRQRFATYPQVKIFSAGLNVRF